jgi:large subunit ribosomal protein L25
MAKEIDLIVEPRDISGTSNARRMRHAGMVPAVIYGAAKETLHLAIDHNQLLRKLANESFLNSILTIKIGNQEESVLIKDIQVHPAKKQVSLMWLFELVFHFNLSMKTKLKGLNWKVEQLLH